MTQPFRLALIAHDQKKDDMVAFARAYEQLLAPCTIVATGTTGGLVQAACPSLTITRVKSGPLGGDQQIGALIAEGKIDGLIFFVDPLSPMPHDVDVKALMRLGSVYDIPMALNRATAEVLVQKRGLLRDDAVTNTLIAPHASEA
jgi:methylglyoxal synthase